MGGSISISIIKVKNKSEQFRRNETVRICLLWWRRGVTAHYLVLTNIAWLAITGVITALARREEKGSLLLKSLFLGSATSCYYIWNVKSSVMGTHHRAFYCHFGTLLLRLIELAKLASVFLGNGRWLRVVIAQRETLFVMTMCNYCLLIVNQLLNGLKEIYVIVCYINNVFKFGRY